MLIHVIAINVGGSPEKWRLDLQLWLVKPRFQPPASQEMFKKRQRGVQNIHEVGSTAIDYDECGYGFKLELQVSIARICLLRNRSLWGATLIPGHLNRHDAGLFHLLHHAHLALLLKLLLHVGGTSALHLEKLRSWILDRHQNCRIEMGKSNAKSTTHENGYRCISSQQKPPHLLIRPTKMRIQPKTVKKNKSKQTWLCNKSWIPKKNSSFPHRQTRFPAGSLDFPLMPAARDGEPWVPAFEETCSPPQSSSVTITRNYQRRFSNSDSKEEKSAEKRNLHISF